MNEENNLNQVNSKKDTIKTVLIVILTILLIASLSFTAYDKLIKKDEVNSDTNTEENNNQENNNQSGQDNNGNEISLDDKEIYKTNNNASLDNVEEQVLPYIISNEEKVLLKDLVFPYKAINGKTGWWSIGKELESFNIDYMTENEKKLLTIFMINDSDIKEINTETHDIPDDCKECYIDGEDIYNTYFSEDVIKQLYKDIFGVDSKFENSDIFVDENDHSQGLCRIPYKYYSNSKKYWGNNQCGGDIGVSLNYYTIVTKVENINDEINVYLQAGRVVSRDYEIFAIFPYRYVDYETYSDGEYKLDTTKALWTGSKDKADSNILDLAKQNKLDTYKFTFKKQSDGKYYVYSGEWV